jgi:hypothetical protein
MLKSFYYLPPFEQGVWRVQLSNMHDVSVLATELAVAPGEGAEEGDVQQAKDLMIIRPCMVNQRACNYQYALFHLAK